MKIEIEDMPKLALSYDEARTRKVAAEAEIAELELERIRGTLCLTEDVVKAWENVLYACKAKFLSMPSKAAPILSSEDNISKIQQIIEDHVKEALGELANYQPEVDPINTSTFVEKPIEGDEGPNPTPAHERRGMGRPKKTAGLTKQR